VSDFIRQNYVVFVLIFSTNLCKQFTDKLTKTHRIGQQIWGNFVPSSINV